MYGNQHLFIPGPTNVPEPVRQAMNIPMEDMRAPDFGAFTKPLLADLKKYTAPKPAPSFSTRPPEPACGKPPSLTR